MVLHALNNNNSKALLRIIVLKCVCKCSCLPCIFTYVFPKFTIAIAIIHSHGMRECCNGHEASHLKSSKFDLSSRRNPLTDLHQNCYAWLCNRRHLACKIWFRIFAPQIRDLAVPWGTCFFRFWGSSITIQPTPSNGTRHCKLFSDRFWGLPLLKYVILPCLFMWLVCFSSGSSIRLQPKPLNGFLRKIHQKTSFPVRKCVLGLRLLYLIFIPPNCWKIAILGPLLTGFLASENHFNIGVLLYKLPLIAVVPPQKLKVIVIVNRNYNLRNKV